MTTPFSKSDRKFLKSVGISAEPAFDDTRLELAQRIARHIAPAQVQVDPQVVQELLAAPDGTVRLLQRFGIPVTRENYLGLAFAGNPPDEPLDGEIEAELPTQFQNNSDEEDES